MKYTGIATIWIVIIILSKDKFEVPSLCAIVHALCLIGEEIERHSKKMIEEKRRASTDLNNTLSAIGLDLVNKLNEKK